MEHIEVNYYTDPLCCWSWALEGHWRKLRKEFGTLLQCRHIMGGMIPDWKVYNDPFNSVSCASQMGPLWYHASQVTGVKMNYNVWNEDPPSSSYPACIAVKCAGLQSQHAEELYLWNLRKTLMEDGRNISRQDVLFDVAEKTQREMPEDFSAEAFYEDFSNGRGKEPFRSDLQKTKFHNIGRYPTITFTDNNGKGIIIVGYRPYKVMLQALNHVLAATHQ